MRTIYCLILISISSVLIPGCSELAKETAKEELIGRYSGKATYIFNFSQYNLGLPDEHKVEDCIVSISKNDYGTYINIPDGQIGIHNLTLLTNGVQFNIFEQTIKTKDNYIMKLIGNPIFFDTNGNKSDGQYNKDINSLQFSFSGFVKTELYGMQYDIPITCNYDLKKF